MKTIFQRTGLTLCTIFFCFALCHAQEKYTVVLPDNYSAEHAYPLFMVFHGGNSNMNFIMELWHSPILRDSFIVAYMEASTLDRAPDRWGWRNFPQERKNIRKYYSEILQSYMVDEKAVYAGGFSLGAKISVDLAMNQTVPVTGFISLNHGGRLSSDCTTENFVKAGTNEIHGIILAGEKDSRYLKESEELRELCARHELPHKYIINLGVGHEAPPQFDVVLDQYISFLREK